MFSNDPRPDAAYVLANSLWFHYHKSPNWTWSVWDNTFVALCVQVNTEVLRDPRFASFLLHIDQHLPDGLDEHVARCPVIPRNRKGGTYIDRQCGLDKPDTHAHPPSRPRGAFDNYDSKRLGLSLMELCPRIEHGRV